MPQVKDLTTRALSDVQYTGLADRLARIHAVSCVLHEMADQIDPKTTREILSSILESVYEAVAFAEISDDEWKEINEAISAGMQIDTQSLN